jgi:tetratricopeptide (TPR) repeat protein
VARSQGDYARATALFEESLAIMRELGDARGIALSLTNLGGVACDQGEYTRAVALLEESLALARPSGDRYGIAVMLHELGNLAADQGEYERAEALLEESLALFSALGERPGVADTIESQGVVASQQGDYGRAEALFAESLAQRRALGDRWGVAASLGNLGQVAYRQGDARADNLLKESLALSRELGARHLLALALEVLVWATVARWQPERAARLGGAAQALREALGVPLPLHQEDGHDQAVRAMRAALGEEGFATAWAAGATFSLEQALDLAHGGTDAAETAAVSPPSDAPTAPAKIRSRRPKGSAQQRRSYGRPNLQLLPGGASGAPTPPEAALRNDEQAQ